MEKEVDYWKVTGIILIFFVVLLLGKSLICNEQKIPTQIGEIDSQTLEQIKNLTSQFEKLGEIDYMWGELQQLAVDVQYGDDAKAKQGEQDGV